MPRTIVITGASSGIGEALALRYAREGARLGLLGRNRERLDRVAAECRGFGAEVHTATIDVRARQDIWVWLEGFDGATPVDLLLANAGVLAQVNGALRIPQADFTPDRLAAEISALAAEPARLAAMAASARTVGRLDAAERLADLVMKVAGI